VNELHKSPLPFGDQRVSYFAETLEWGYRLAETSPLPFGCRSVGDETNGFVNFKKPIITPI